MEFPQAAQAGVMAQLPLATTLLPGFKRSPASASCSWDHRHAPPRPANFVFLAEEPPAGSDCLLNSRPQVIRPTQLPSAGIIASMSHCVFWPKINLYIVLH